MDTSVPTQSREAAVKETAASFKTIDEINREHILSVLKQCVLDCGANGSLNALYQVVST